jgi:antitoxin (DNA-binding transcriptional repressor) of toxin-antitoxin stability system
MRQYNMHEAKTHLSALVKDAIEGGESFTIALSGKPQVKVIPLGGRAPSPRNGFLKGYGKIPPANAFNNIASLDIQNMFEGESKQ